MVNFLNRISDCGSRNPTLLDLFISFDPSICFTVILSPFGNAGHVFVSVLIDFPLNSKGNIPFH